MRSVALDVHLDFCEVAIVENGELRSPGRIETKPETLELFARSLGAHDYVVLEVTGNAWEIARIIEPHVAQVLVVSPSDTGIRQARAKTDRLDARTLARLLAAGSLDAARGARDGRRLHAPDRVSRQSCSVIRLSFDWFGDRECEPTRRRPRPIGRGRLSSEHYRTRNRTRCENWG